MHADDRKNTLHHERLDAYAVAAELDGAVVAIAQRAGRGHGWIADQAMRAGASVVLYLAEGFPPPRGSAEREHGAGHRASGGRLDREGADRARALRIARGSALELDAALTLMLHRGACRLEAGEAAKRLTLRVVAMLTALPSNGHRIALSSRAAASRPRGNPWNRAAP